MDHKKFVIKRIYLWIKRNIFESNFQAHVLKIGKDVSLIVEEECPEARSVDGHGFYLYFFLYNRTRNTPSWHTIVPWTSSSHDIYLSNTNTARHVIPLPIAVAKVMVVVGVESEKWHKAVARACMPASLCVT